MKRAVNHSEGDPYSTRYSLLSRLHNRDDQESWKDFFDTYWRLIYSIATKSGLSDAEAQDVVQEAVISVAKDIHKFRRDRSLGSFRGWLRNIVRWRISDYLEKNIRPAADPDHPPGADEEWSAAADIPDSSDASLEALWDREWQAHLFEAAINRVKQKVKEEQFQMFDLYAIQRVPVMDVARRLGVSIGAIYVAKHRIAALLKKEIRLLEDGMF